MLILFHISFSLWFHWVRDKKDPFSDKGPENMLLPLNVKYQQKIERNAVEEITLYFQKGNGKLLRISKPSASLALTT